MSSRKIVIAENADFIERFKEVCGTSQPSVVARLLNISYQAAKNYLHGRLPDSAVLQTIADKTPYSLHWLLTGRGEKFVESVNEKKNADILADNLREFLRRECAQIVGELLEIQNQSELFPQPRIVVLSPDKIKEETILEESDVSSVKRS